MKRALSIAGLVLVAATTAACGGDGGSGAPTDASEDDFCAAYQSIAESAGGLASGGEPDPEQLVEAFNDWGAELEETGTPEDIPDDAREGFEIGVEQLTGIEAGDIESIDDLDSIDEDLSDSEQEATEAFGDWADETCGAPGE